MLDSQYVLPYDIKVSKKEHTMEQYFNFVKSDDEMDDLYVLTTNENIAIQVVPYGEPDAQFFVYNKHEEVGPAPTLRKAMVIAIAAQVIEEFGAEFLSAAAG
jgi:hypothetical protein